MTIVCQMCGAEFEAAGKNAKFCIDCKKQRKRDWQRKNYLTRTQGPDIAEKYLAAAKSVKSMNDVLAKADAAGLSYGQYVAEEERKKAMNQKNEAAPVPNDIVRLLIAKAADALERSEVDCKEIGEARGLLTAVKMILEGGT